MALPEVTALENTCVLETPSPLLDAAFRCAKDNIARSMRWYTLGWGVSHAPHQNAVVVGRDTSWVTRGADYVAPWFTPAALAIFRDRQRPNGLIAAFVDMETGRTDDDPPVVTDHTPLYIRAVVQRYRHYPSPFYREAFSASVRRAADRLLDAIGPNGLILSEGERTDLNTIAVDALRMAAEFTGESLYRDASDQLTDIINERLWDQKSGAYLLGRDTAGKADPQLTGDMVLPVLLGVAPAERAARVLERLGQRDFQTPRGIRTLPQGEPASATQDVRSDRTLWYAAAVAASDPKRALDAIERVARPVVEERESREAKTVPGAFAESFDAESGVRLGMELAPWVAPIFLRTVLEGLLGLSWINGEPRFVPNWPDGWDEVTIRALPTGAGSTDVTLRRGEEFRLPYRTEDDESSWSEDSGEEIADALS